MKIKKSKIAQNTILNGVNEYKKPRIFFIWYIKKQGKEEVVKNYERF